MVGTGGFEPPTSCVSSKRSNQLSYAPGVVFDRRKLLLKRNEISFEHLKLFDPDLSATEEQVFTEVETRIKYEGYINRQEIQVEKLKRMENVSLPEEIDYQIVHGLSTEVREKLTRVRPLSLGQASRIAGVTPAALMAIQVHLKSKRT